MATIESTKLRKGVVFRDGNKVYLVVDYKHVKKGRGLATVRVKVKDIETGANIEKTFTSNEKVESETLSHQSAQYLYSDGNSVFFMNSEDYSQFAVPVNQVEDQLKYLKEGMKVDILWLDEKPVSISLPIKVRLKVAHTEPAVVGDTAASATKEAKLETGLSIQVPLFIKNGDVLLINTEKGEYVSKASRSN